MHALDLDIAFIQHTGSIIIMHFSIDKAVLREHSVLSYVSRRIGMMFLVMRVSQKLLVAGVYMQVQTETGTAHAQTSIDVLPANS